MKTKIINNKYLTDDEISFLQSLPSSVSGTDTNNLYIDPKYTNYVREVSNIYVRANNTANLSFLTNYPKSNLLNESMFKEVIVNKDSGGAGVDSGLTIDLDNSSLDNYDTIVIRFNRLNADLRAFLYRGGQIVVNLHTALGTIPGASYEQFTFGIDTTNKGTTYSGTEVVTQMIDPDDPIILIDKTLREGLSSYSGSPTLSYQYITITGTNPSDTNDTYCAVSNVTVTNSVDFDDYFLNENVISAKKELTSQEFSEDHRRFKETRGFYKTLKGKIDLLSKDNINDLRTRVFNFNKSRTGFYLFPQTEDLSFYLESLRQGGLFYMKNDLNVDNVRYNLYNMSLDLEEVL